MTDVPAIGARVHVPGVGTGTLRGRRGSGLVVEIKGFPVVVPADLVTVAGGPKRRKPSVVEPEDAAGPSDPGEPAAVDLHGLTVPQAVEALDTFLNAAMLEGRGTVLVVHGRSGGRLRAAVHQRLRQLPSIRSYRVDPRNPGQTIVSL